MDCPRCNTEMSELQANDTVLRRCTQCTGVWIDVADLNRVLLHHNMPALQSLGGLVNPDASDCQCPECQVDLTIVEGGEKRSVHYATCEVCGGIFLQELGDAEGADVALNAIVAFFKRFKRKG